MKRTILGVLFAFLIASGASLHAAPLKLINEPSSVNYSEVAASSVVQSQLKSEVATLCALPSVMTFSQMSIAKDAYGDTHVRYRKALNGLTVYGTQTIAHISMAGRFREITDATVSISGAATAASITSDAAVSTATAYATQDGAINVYLASSPSLCYYFSADSATLTLCYKVRLRGDGDGLPMCADFYVNATSGGIVIANSLINDARVRRIYDANNVCSDGTLARSEGQSAANIAAVDNAYADFGECYDFYSSRYTRDSYDNFGATIYATVNYLFSSGTGANACWDNDAKRFYIGNGLPSYSVNFANAYDVPAHEYFHAITDSTSNLAYSYQSGALNESLSDIFAATLEWKHDGAMSTSVWTLGEDLGSILRRMDTPSSVAIEPGSYCPDHMNEYYNLTYYTDYGGVHYNSSIPNHAFYLLSQGGKQATGDSTIGVVGLGIQEAADIFYDANLSYFEDGTNFAEAAQATARSAINFGKRAVSSVISAWYAVGVLSTPWGNNNEGWKISFTGWTYFDSSFYVYSYDYGWAYWTLCDINVGSYYLYLSGPGKWVFTSAEMYPWFYDYASSSWKQNTGGAFD